MPPGFGRDSHIGWVEEDPYGTVVTPPTKFLEPIAESIRTIRTRTPRPNFRKLDVAEGDTYDEKFGAEGGFTGEINYNDALNLYLHAFGAEVIAVLEAAISWTHTFTLTDLLQTAKGLTFYSHKGVDEYQAQGCKIDQLRLTFDPTRNGQLEVSIAGQDVVGVAFSTPSFPDIARYVPGHATLMEIDDVARNFDLAELTLNNALDIDKRILGSKSIDEPVRGDGMREVTGVLTVDAEATDWDNFRAGTLFKLEILHTGPVLGANNFLYNLTALKCLLLSDPIRLENAGIVKAEWEFMVQKPTAGEMLELVVVNDEEFNL